MRRYVYLPFPWYPVPALTYSISGVSLTFAPAPSSRPLSPRPPTDSRANVHLRAEERWHCAVWHPYMSDDPRYFANVIRTVPGVFASLFSRPSLSFKAHFLVFLAAPTAKDYGVVNESDIVDSEIVQRGFSQVSISCLIVSEANLVSSLMAKETAKLRAQAAKGKLPALISGAGLDNIDVGHILSKTGKKRNSPSDGLQGRGQNKRRSGISFTSHGPSRAGSTAPSISTPLRFSASPATSRDSSVIQLQAVATEIPTAPARMVLPPSSAPAKGNVQVTKPVGTPALETEDEDADGDVDEGEAMILEKTS
ncbi:hypothetical protein DFH09DRAFT_1322436 [Mycena vulgaris]|nr:hypothetical protein DFH09DRAFT_1322436 [Mycena vulgaris]